jgi:hypothetical protein
MSRWIDYSQSRHRRSGLWDRRRRCGTQVPRRPTSRTSVGSIASACAAPLCMDWTSGAMESNKCTTGARCRVQSAWCWCLVRGASCLVRGAACRVPGAACRVPRAWRLVLRASCLVLGQRGGERVCENGVTRVLYSTAVDRCPHFKTACDLGDQPHRRCSTRRVEACRSAGTRQPARGTRHEAPGTRHQARSTKHEAPSTKHQARSTPHQAPAPCTLHDAPSTPCVLR